MIGQKIHSYEIVAHLGKGGMGNVYKATDTMLGRDVALKMLHPQLTMESQFLERFKKEARVLAQLLHPNIAVIYNFIEQDGDHFMVMEYVEGTNLDDLLKMYKTLPAEFIVPVFIQVLEGLQHAHRKNIFHRDIKPANIMITPDGTVKLMDFGIAKVAGEQKMTQVNKIVGTVEFMAPELIQGQDASASSDIYAAGVTMYELISGKLPFEADTDFNLMQAILKQKTTQPGKVNPAVPKQLGDIVMKAMAKNPNERFADAKGFQKALLNAFPGYRDVSLASLQNQSSAMATVIQDRPTMLAGKPTVEMPQGMNPVLAKLSSAFQKFSQHVSEYKRVYTTAAALLLILFITIAVIKNKPAPANDTPEAEKKENIENRNSTEMVSVPVQENNERPNIPVRENNPVEKKKEIAPEKITNKKPDEKPQEKLVEETVEEKPAPRRDVYIKSKVEVELYLQTNLANAEERKEIPVSFTVSNSVDYEGITIVNKGSVATGTIKLGKVLTDISIEKVTAANGAQISLKAQKSHGRRNEVTSERNYTAFILPGTRINF